MRSTWVLGLIGGVYAIFGGVIWAAYHEFGNQSLLDLTPLVAADPTPLKLVPDDRTQEDTATPSRPGGQTAPAAALAGTPRAASSVGEARPAEARWSDPEQGSEIGRPAAIERPAIARYETEPDVAVDILASEEWSVAPAPETPRDVPSAASLESAAPTVSDEAPPSRPAATSAPAPAFKPLEVMPTVVAEAMPGPATLSAPEASRSAARTISPPKPSLKPIVMPSKPRPAQLARQVAEQDTRAVAATGQTLPEALQAFWTNLKILLAAAPRSAVIPAGGDDSDGGRSGARADVASAGGGGSTSGGSSSSSSGVDGGNSGGNSSSSGSGGGSTSGGGGGSSPGGGGGSSSGGAGGDNGGGKGGNGGKGGKGSKGGRGDDDRGGRGGGKGGGGGGDD